LEPSEEKEIGQVLWKHKDHIIAGKVKFMKNGLLFLCEFRKDKYRKNNCGIMNFFVKWK